jgi:copper chaperone
MFNFGSSKIYTIKIEGMKCEHCAKKVSDSLKHIKGVKKVDINLDEKMAIVKANVKDESTLIEEMKNEIQSFGFEVVSIE